MIINVDFLGVNLPRELIIQYKTYDK